MTDELIASLIVVMAFFQVVFVIATIFKNNGLVDVSWGLGFIVASWIIAIRNSQFLILLIPITIWGLRLAGHIYLRSRRSEEDWRYKKWREDWGKWTIPRAWLQVFVLQGFLQWVILIPVVLALSSQALLNNWYLIFAGFMLWIGGFALEATADFQLKEFIKTKKKGQVLTSGAWAYTRHPNYFGEAMLWWGIWFICLGSVIDLPLWTIIGPITINFLVRYVSGVPFLEKRYADNPEFQEYKKKVPIFIPKIIQ